ncbi:MAG TPA: FimV/HubP family polar landmark protein [Steroidobacteraceae bacterium]|nr:FimV/HubP family polar landmark protein [Steroidobacteraceae bacterium]
MIAKRSSRALALLLALPSAAFALGLGDIRLLSPLNAPLDAEIDLIDVTPEEMGTVQAQLASRETFARYGLDWPAYLSSVQVRTVRTADGREVIKLKSTDSIADPFVTLLVEVNWARGKLVREYTMLLDPPVFTPGQSQVASAPVTAPAAGGGSREGAIARKSEPAPAATTASAATPPLPAAVAAPAAAAAPAAEAAPSPAETAPAVAEMAAATSAATTAAIEAGTAAAAPPAPEPLPMHAEVAATQPESSAASAQPAPLPPEPVASSETASASSEEAASASQSTSVAESTDAAPLPSSTSSASRTESEGTHTVRRGESLSRIAAGVAGEKVGSAHTRSWMLAIYQANPHAFQNNMNILHSGAVLRIPDAETAAAVSPSEAASEIRRQYAAWRGPSATGGESPAAEQPGRLKLVTPSESASAGAAPGAAAGESAALQGRVKELEGQLAESKRLLEMKDAELARMQAQLAAKQQGAQPAPAPAPSPVAAPPPPAAVEQPPAAPPPAAPEEKPQETAAPPPPPVASVPPVSHPPKRTVPAPESGGSFLGTLLGYWWVLLVAAIGAGAVAGFRIWRARRASQFDASLGRLGAAGVGDIELGFPEEEPEAAAPTPATAISATRAFAGAEAAVRGRAAPAPEPAFLVEETGSHERPRLGTAGAAPMPTARHVASDETISSETAINLDQGDPLAEADFHMAYGLYDQAADLIRIAISREPNRRDLKLKLLEVFFVWGNKDQFLQTARELAETRAEAAPGEWEKILIMGKQLAPEDALFSGAGAVTGAAAGGVDLDLEGGQSRVDFDLIGEPVPGEAAHAVDLDIGSAVGDHETTTSVTDRNVALAENSFVGATTGTTRQMTARMRRDTGTAEMEGPTVEQPALPGAHQPTIRQKLETAMRKGVSDATAELAIDDLGLDVGSIDTVDQPGPASPQASSPDTPTLVAGLDERSRKVMEDAHRRAATEENPAIAATGAWSFDQNELEAALTQTSVSLANSSDTSRLAALRGHAVDVDLSDATGTHAATATDVDLDVGAATGTHANGGLDLDVGTATVPDAAFAATQRLASEELALPDLEPVTMSEVGTKLDLARAYMDMGDPDGARNILEEVLTEGSAAQKQEAQRLMESLP